MAPDGAILSQAQALIARGDARAAETRLRPLLRGRKSDAPVLELLAFARSAQGDLSGALTFLNQAMACDPSNANAPFNKGMILFQAGQAEAAATAFAQTLALDARNVQAWLARGDALSQLQRWDEALACYEGALKRDPNLFAAISARGAMLGRLERHADALAAFETVLVRTPNDPVALYNKGRSLAGQMRFEDAVAAYDAALQVGSKDFNVWINRGVALEGLGRREEAMRSYENAAETAQKTGRDDGAALFNQCVLLLGDGDYARGFSLYDRRYAQIKKEVGRIVSGMPLWRGELVSGALRIWSEQGVGDQILFSRLIPLVLAHAPNLIWECDPRLVGLVQSTYRQVNVRSYDDPACDAEVQACMSDLPAVLGVRRPDDVPRAPSWQIPAERVEALRSKYLEQAKGRPIIGIAWASNAATGKFKGAALSEWRALLTRDYMFVSLQYGPVSEDLAAARAMFGCDIVVDSEIDQMTDMEGFFAQIAALNHVVTISNTTAHVAGALAKPAIVMPPPGRGLHWYWGVSGERSVWHPSLRLVRREIAQDCADQVAAAVRVLQQELTPR
jgi:tetratricopeptide (TPR) repeat protein